MTSYKIPHYSLRLIKEKTHVYAAECVLGPSEAASVLHKLIGMRDTEHMAVLFLDNRNHIVGSTIVAIGAMSGMLIAPRDVFKAAIMANAGVLLMGHNHPSGDPSPSKEDGAFTVKVEEAGRVLGIGVVDRVIVTNFPNKSFSFREKGMMGS
jgi:DNA repair protein RadC